ncbi:MAG: hypothetical protein VZR04_02700, partial [Succiniclasticum sp.]|nr:hypothetical protein [Succiniclasticum sp.]
MNRLAKWIAGIAVLFCALFLGTTQIVLPGLLQQAGPYAEKLAADYVNGSVQIGPITWPGSNTLLIRDVTVRDKKQQNVATVPEIRVSVNPFKAFSGLEKAVSLIELEKPTVYIIQSKDESWNYEKLLKPSQSETTPFYGKINIKQGTAVVQLPEGTWQYQIDGSVDGSYNPAFDLHFKVSAPGLEPATVLGSIDNKGVGKIVMKSDAVDLAPYHPLALRYGQVKGAAGLVTDIDGEWTNDGKNTVLKGKMNLRDVRGSYQMKEQDVPFRITGAVSSADHVISTDQLQVSINGQTAVLSGTVDIHDLDNPEGHLSLRSEKVSYEGETLTNIEAEAVMAGNKAAVNYFSAAYRGGRISGQGVYELASGKLTGTADIRKVTLDGEKVNGEKFLLNAALAGSGTYNQGDGKLNVNVAANTMNLQWRDTVLNVMDFDADVTNDGVDIRTFSAFAESGALQASGNVSFDGGYDLQGRMASMPLAPVLAAAGQEGSGLVSSSYHLYGQGSRFNFEGPVQLQQTSVRELFLENGSGYVTVHDNVLELRDY